MRMTEVSTERPLPDNLDAERFVLGAVMSDDTSFLQVAGNVSADDFSLEKHKRIFLRMMDLHERGERIDRVTLANELNTHGQLQSVDGLSYLVSLDDGLPQLHNLESYVNIVKEKSLLRRIISVSQDTINRCLTQDDNPKQILGAAEDAFMKLGDANTRNALVTPNQIINEYEGGINSFLDTSKRIKGISTGFLKLDEMTGGFREGELIILAARPAMGKTAFALNIAQHVTSNLKTPKAVAVFSLEMSKESLLTRMVCAAARVDQQRFRAGYLNHEERSALQEALYKIVESPLYLDDSAGTNLMDVHSKLQRLQAEQDLGLVIVDYLQLMQGRGRFENRQQEISTLSRGFKLMSKELRVPFLVLSQLSRAPETRPGDHRPMLSDLRESGSIEQDADVVGFIFREEVYRPDKESLKGTAEFILAKQRNGPTGRVKLAFLNRFTKFETWRRIPVTMYLLNSQAPERLPLTQAQFQPAKDACRLSSANAGDLFPGARNSKAALAGALLRLGCWTQSHEIAQDNPSPEGSYWHAIIHRLEPDPFNAQYWFRRVGRHAIFPDLHERAAEIIRLHGLSWRLKNVVGAGGLYRVVRRGQSSGRPSGRGGDRDSDGRMATAVRLVRCAADLINAKIWQIMRLTIAILLTLLCARFSPAAALNDDPDVAGAERLFSTWIQGQLAYRNLPGIAVGLVQDQRLVWAQGFGFADVGAKTPMTPETKFRMASHSKLFTATAIMQLRDAGKIHLDDRWQLISRGFRFEPRMRTTPPSPLRNC